jgi:peptidoglycan-associated lipoprotein
MKRAVTIITCLCLFTIGCKKGDQEVTNQDDANSANEDADDTLASKAPTPVIVETGADEVKDLLLALKRVHFSLDSSMLTEAGKQGLNEAAEKLAVLSRVTLFVDGHTDDRGTTEYNMSLGERRAQTVIDYLKRLGIDSDRLRRVSFGEESPISGGGGALDLAKNRRVDFRIMYGDVLFTLEESALLDDSGKPI